MKGRYEVKLKNGKELAVKQENLVKLKTDQFNNQMLNIKTSKEKELQELKMRMGHNPKFMKFATEAINEKYSGKDSEPSDFMKQFEENKIHF